ncbi:MAG: AAA family ATPase [Chloroflexota bacterium]
MIFDSHPAENPPVQQNPERLAVRICLGNNAEEEFVETFSNNQPILSQLAGSVGAYGSRWQYLTFEVHLFGNSGELESAGLLHLINSLMGELRSMQFLDLNPEAIRIPSYPGQTILGDRGENLSAVLQDICTNKEKKKALIQWVDELTPMDVADFTFSSDLNGKILVNLVEADKSVVSANSASDGTLRFLALATAMFSPNSSTFYFVEELENDIHPTRLYLLLQLIENRLKNSASEEIGNKQLVTTTHSPQLLRFLSPSALDYTSLIYRLLGNSDGQIKKILEIPEARRIMEQQDLGHLQEAGWLEDVVVFLDEAVMSQ